MKRKFHSGVTLIELVVTMAVSLIIISAVTVLLMGGNRGWQQTYDSATKKIKQDAQTVAIKFGSMGRKSNRLGYVIYNINGGTFTPVVPTQPEEVVSGDAVEFRYWDVSLDSSDSHDLMDVTKTATAYALFYLDGDQLKVDYGAYPPGAVLAGGDRNTTDITTTILADNVSTDPDIGAFSHSTIGGVGQGSIRINITLTDPNDGDSIKVMTATLTRNVWPR
ncbi:MAG: prepilin-type N-terminal cleavage/methylation domain-containing protein [Phycisphaerae bacterium]|jgi:prepilin-type N-terminal cleavage/methylation domain-containing protein